MDKSFKKGQIVPRRLRKVLFKDRKAQHCAVFGCDCTFDGNVFVAMSSGPLVYIKNSTRRMNNGTRKKVPCTVKDLYLVLPNA
jgi:hypothetical protein